MLTAKGDINRHKCLFCHAHAEKRTTRVRSGNPDLRTDQVRLCRSCHPTHVDYFKPGHVGIRVPAEMMARMSPRLRLTRDRRIVCTTCHSPHEQGVFSSRSVMSYNTMERTGARGVTTPTRRHPPCSDCHRNPTVNEKER